MIKTKPLLTIMGVAIILISLVDIYYSWVSARIPWSSIIIDSAAFAYWMQNKLNE